MIRFQKFFPLFGVVFFYANFSMASPIESKDACPDQDGRAITVPAPVDVAMVLESMALLKNVEGKSVLDLDANLVKEVHEIFDTTKVKTKMEQFYTLLFVLGNHLNPSPGKNVELEAATAREVLLKATVFPDPSIPSQIQKISVNLSHSKEPRYWISFQDEKTVIPLNKGEGFYLFRNGLCQHAQSLVFRKDFSVSLKQNKKKHIVAFDFKGVDLFGTFGNRGIVDVDLNYIELRSVEFYKGTPEGKVTAYVSKEEFKQNSHNPLLKIITRIVPDRSVQAIDW